MFIHSTILGVVRPHPQCGTLIAIKNHQIGPHNWKTVKNYEKNKSYAARAYDIQLLLLIFIIT